MAALLKVTALVLAGAVLALALTDPGVGGRNGDLQAPQQEPVSATLGAQHVPAG
jgi:hypothetical protein